MLQTLGVVVVKDQETVIVLKRKERVNLLLVKEVKARNEGNTMKMIVTAIEANHHKNARRSNRKDRSRNCQPSNASRSFRRLPYPHQNLMEIPMVVVVAGVAVGVVVVAVAAQVAEAEVAAEAEVVAALKVTMGNLKERSALSLMMKIITRQRDQNLDHVLSQDPVHPPDLGQDHVLVQALVGLGLADQGLDLVNQDPVHQVAADLVQDLSRAQKAVLVHGLHLNQAINFVILLVFIVYL